MSATAVPTQLPGCLPEGYGLDSLLTPEQFCLWMQVKMRWFASHWQGLPGVFGETIKVVRCHPRTYLAAKVPTSVTT